MCGKLDIGPNQFTFISSSVEKAELDGVAKVIFYLHIC